MAMAEKSDKTPKDFNPLSRVIRQDERKDRGGWLAKIAPGVSKFVAKRETPENLWVTCPDTGEMLYRHDLERSLWVTPSGFHMRLNGVQRLSFSFDNAQYETIDYPNVSEDPLVFSDGKPYSERLKAARKSVGRSDTMLIGAGLIEGVKAVILAQDFSFMGGSLGMAAGEGFIAAVRAAIERKSALIVFTASGGARMQEGALSLMQMARTTLAIQELKKNRLPYIVVLTDPTTGGVTASYAMLGDVHLAEPGALIGFAGPRVIETTIREKLPDGFQRAEYLVEKGMVDRVVHRQEMTLILSALISMLMGGQNYDRS